MSLIRYWPMVCVVALAVSVFGDEPAKPQSKIDPKVAARIAELRSLMLKEEQISSQDLRLLKTAPTREVLLKALRANPTLKAALEKETPMIHGGTTANPQADPEEVALDALDWRNGITITPTHIPTYGSPKSPLASVSIAGVTYYSRGDWWSFDGLSGATFVLDVPDGPATYIVSLQLVRFLPNVTSPNEWVSGPNCRIHVCAGPGVGSLTPVQLVPIAGRPGYTGLFSVTPVSPGPPIWGPPRKQNLTITIECDGAQMPNDAFYGLTIAKY